MSECGGRWGWRGCVCEDRSSGKGASSCRLQHHHYWTLAGLDLHTAGLLTGRRAWTRPLLFVSEWQIVLHAEQITHTCTENVTVPGLCYLCYITVKNRNDVSTMIFIKRQLLKIQGQPDSELTPSPQTIDGTNKSAVNSWLHVLINERFSYSLHLLFTPMVLQDLSDLLSKLSHFLKLCFVAQY